MAHILCDPVLVAAIMGMVTVRVEVAAFAPGITEGTDSPQVGSGEGPATAQES